MKNLEQTFVENLFNLEGRVALVTGASSGIGRHMAKVLAAAGAKVILVARRETVLEGVVDKINRAGGIAACISIDLSHSPELERLVEEAEILFGGPDILVNAAGVNFRQSSDQINWESWNNTLTINLSVPFFLAKGIVPGMKRKGYGRIINIASLQSYRAFAHGMAYGASKGGIVQLTRAMAQEWSVDGICTNAIAPGFFPTELTEPIFSDPSMTNYHAAMTAIGRNGELRDLDGITVFLASESSQYLTGQVIPVDGGYTAK